jgi:diphthine-ammonia ligase
MKLAALFTGGKDSTYAIHLARQNGHEIVCLITLKSQNPDSYMFHTPAIEVTELQAKSMGIPHLLADTTGEKEKELVDLERAIITAKWKYNFEGVLTGALASVYQATRIQKICFGIDLWCFNPLWMKDPLEEMQELLSHNFEFIFSSVAADGLTKDWLNKKITSEDLERLKLLNANNKLSFSGEGGEFETLVTKCPMFEKEVIITARMVMENSCTGKLIVTGAELK